MRSSKSGLATFNLQVDQFQLREIIQGLEHVERKLRKYNSTGRRPQVRKLRKQLLRLYEAKVRS